MNLDARTVIIARTNLVSYFLQTKFGTFQVRSWWATLNVIAKLESGFWDGVFGKIVLTLTTRCSHGNYHSDSVVWRAANDNITGKNHCVCALDQLGSFVFDARRISSADGRGDIWIFLFRYLSFLIAVIFSKCDNKQVHFFVNTFSFTFFILFTVIRKKKMQPQNI